MRLAAPTPAAARQGDPSRGAGGLPALSHPGATSGLAWIPAPPFLAPRIPGAEGDPGGPGHTQRTEGASFFGPSAAVSRSPRSFCSVQSPVRPEVQGLPHPEKSENPWPHPGVLGQHPVFSAGRRSER